MSLEDLIDMGDDEGAVDSSSVTQVYFDSEIDDKTNPDGGTDTENLSSRHRLGNGLPEDDPEDSNAG